MARILKGSDNFTCTPRIHPLMEWIIPAFSFHAEAGTHLPTPEGWKAELAWVAGWLHTEINVRHRELNLDMVAHLSTNQTRRRLTSLIEANVLTTMPDHQKKNVSRAGISITRWRWWKMTRITMTMMMSDEKPQTNRRRRTVKKCHSVSTAVTPKHVLHRDSQTQRQREQTSSCDDINRRLLCVSRSLLVILIDDSSNHDDEHVDDVQRQVNCHGTNHTWCNTLQWNAI